ncbi:MAG: peptide ABC transporter substrate-binding protein [Pirellulaceae bacterium]|nr:MAG: peptide ABC transporter substrate-binding protein [Pirellulaceae bacterium]
MSYRIATTFDGADASQTGKCRGNAGPGPLRLRSWLCLTRLAFAVLFGLGHGVSHHVFGQARADSPGSEEPLYQQKPFDVLVLKRDGSRHKIVPLDVPMRRVVPQPGGFLRFRLLSDPAEELVVAWNDVERVELFEQLVLAEARRLIADKQFNEAFRHLLLLVDKYPHTEGLNETLDEYLFARAADDASAKRWSQALSHLEELYRRNANYQSASGTTVLAAMSGVVANLSSEYIAKEDFRAARRLLARLSSTYGEERLPALAQIRQQLVRIAQQRADRAKQLAAENRLREAQQEVQQALAVWPRLEGAFELAVELIKRYPVVTVGVAQQAATADRTALDDWAARRVGYLVQPSLVEFLGPGPEGGHYRSPFGKLDRSDDYRLLALQLPIRSDSSEPRPTAYDISHMLVELADPELPGYVPQWAELLQTVRADGMWRVEAALRRPYVLPEALLRQPLAHCPSGAAWEERMRVFRQSEAEGRLVFVRQPSHSSSRGTGPAEIHELPYNDTRDAIDDLKRGKILVLDRVFPADAVKLLNSSDESLVIRPYAVPTVHVLVPNYDHPYLANPTFRRALIHAIPRQLILERLYDGKPVAGCRVISAALPAAGRPGDASAYAYDESLPEQPFDPGLALLLLGIAKQQLKVAAEKAQQTPPDLEPLVLAYPDDTVARFVTAIIAEQLQRLEIPCRLQPLESVANGSWHLRYVALTIEEPLADVVRLFGGGGIAPSPNPYVQLALRRLQEAGSWREVRRRSQELHQVTYGDATVIPLFQTVEFYAYHKNVHGIGDSVSSLYQNIAHWQIEPHITVEE